MRDAMSGELIATLDGRAGSYGVFSPDSRSFVPTGNAVRVYDVRTGKMVRECEGGDVGVWVPVFTPDGSRIICMTSTSMLGVWDVATGRRVAQLPFSGLISMHPDGTLAVIGSDRIVRFVRPSGDVDDPLAAPSGATGDLARQQ
jgi:WD40 repeat protein